MDGISVSDNSSPISFSFSDVGSYDFDFNENSNDDQIQSGPSNITGGLLESLPSSDANEEVSSESLNMVHQYTCEKCPRSFEKQHQLK